MQKYVVGAIITTFVVFLIGSFYLRLSPQSSFRSSWSQLKREDNHILMNVVHIETYRVPGFEAEVLWQGGEASGESMGCVVNLFRKVHGNRSFLKAFAGVCPQEFAYRGYMIDWKMEEYFYLGLAGCVVFLLCLYFSLHSAVYRKAWTAWVQVVLISGLFGLNVAHLFPWAVIFPLPVQIRLFTPG